MTPPHFQIGKKVEIIGPTITGVRGSIGEKFVVSRCRCGEYTGDGFPWYPASSLRLVEELKIGDWVRVVGPAGNGSDFSRGYIFQISEKSPIGEFSTKKAAWYPAASLQKLTPDEIKQHASGDCRRALTKACIELNLPYNRPPMETIDAMLSTIERLSAIENNCKELENRYLKWSDRICAHDNQLDAIRKRMDELGPSHTELLGDMEALVEKVGDIGKQQKEMWERHDINCERIDKAEDKISVIEKRQSLQQNRIDRQRGDLLVMQKRLAVLEGERPEVIDREQFCVPDNAFFLVRSGENGKVVIEYSESGFELVKAVLNSMEEAR